MAAILDLAEIPRKLKELQEEPGRHFVFIALFGGSVIRLWGDLEAIAICIPVMFFLTMVMYRTGSSLDWLFDQAFAPKTDTDIPYKWMGRRMRSARTRAAWFITHGPWDKKEDPVLKADDKESIYNKAEILHGRDSADWKKKVKWFLEISKSARSFILPLAFVVAYDVWDGKKWPLLLPRLVLPCDAKKFEHFDIGTWFRKVTFLASDSAQWVSLALLILMIVLYVGLRLHHMTALYRLVANSSFARARVDLPQTVECETVSGHGLLLLIGPLEIRRVMRKNGDSKLPSLMSNSLTWTG